MPVGGATLSRRPFQQGVEHRREVAGRGIDDLQYLGGRRLLLQGLARLGDEPRVFHCDDRLSREILHERDLLVRERADFLTIGGNVTEERAVLSERNVKNGTSPFQLGGGPRDRELPLASVWEMNEALPVQQPIRSRAGRIVLRLA